MRSALNRVTFGPGEKLARPRQSASFGILARVGDNSRERRAGRHIVGFGVPLISKFVSREMHLPAVDVHLPLAKVFRLHACPNGFAAPFSTGAPTRLPHSVQDPS